MRYVAHTTTLLPLSPTQVKPEGAKGLKPGAPYYKIQATEDGAFFDGRRAEVVLVRPVAGQGQGAEEAKGDERESIVLGTFGAIHPLVIQKEAFNYDKPCSAVELNLEPFL